MPKAPHRLGVHCPVCGKPFRNSTVLLQHANQPLGRCRLFGRQSHARVFAIAVRSSQHQSLCMMDAITPAGPPCILDIKDHSELLDDNSDFVKYFPGASESYDSRRSFLDNFNADTYAPECTSNVYYPFADSRDWEMAQWLTLSGLSMLKIDKFLSTQLVCPSLDSLPSASTRKSGQRASAIFFQCQEATETN